MYLGMENTVFLSGRWREAQSVFMEVSGLYLSRKMSRAVIAEKVGGVRGSPLHRNRKRLWAKMGKGASLRKVLEIKKVLNRDK